jgi:hypothetical protein
MSNLRQLLATWETWSAHDTLTRALGHVPNVEPTMSALDALRDSAELIDLLTGWQWQAMYAARCDGASWEQIGSAMRTTAQLTRAMYLAAIMRPEVVLGRDVSTYHRVL